MATQVDLASHLFLTDRTIRDLQKLPGAPQSRGRGGYDLDEWRKYYIDYLKGQKAGSTIEDPYGDKEERALARRERELKLEDREENVLAKRAKRWVFEKTYAPIWLITDAVQLAATAMNSRLESLLPKIKLACPDLSPGAIEVLKQELIAASNEIANLKPDLSEYEESDSEGDFSWSECSEENVAD